MNNQSTPFVSSAGESRNPLYDGQFDGETPEQAVARQHWARVATENAALKAGQGGAATVSKSKFDCLVDHAQRQDLEIARLRYDENTRRFYDEGAVWFWAGDETDNLETLACPVVINAGDLRAMIAQSAPGAAVQICKLGLYGKAYDAPGTCRAYTYADQPDNGGAWQLGGAVMAANQNSGGDYIDRGLGLLKRLQERGFGVFEIATASEQKESKDA